MRFVSWVIMCALCARYASADPAEAQQLFESGRALAKDGKWAEACEVFGKSIAIQKTIGTELNLGECNEHLGRLREAWGMYVAAAGDAAVEGDAKRATFGRERAAALEPKMTVVVVKVAQPRLNNLLITIGGRATQPSAEIHERADPGTIEVIATAPGLPQIKLAKEGAAGGELAFQIPRMDPLAPVDDTAAPPPAQVTVDGPRSAARIHVAYGLGIGGIAAVLAAGTLTAVARDHYDNVANGADCMKVTGGVHCNATGDQSIHDAQHLADIGTVAAIGGAALLGSAAIVYFTAPRERIIVQPQASTKSVGFAISGAF